MRRRLHDLGDMICCALLMAAFVAFALAAVSYLIKLPAPAGILAG